MRYGGINSLLARVFHEQLLWLIVNYLSKDLDAHYNYFVALGFQRECQDDL